MRFIFSVHKIEQSASEGRHFIIDDCGAINSIVNLISPTGVSDNDNYCCKIGDINPFLIMGYPLIIDFTHVLSVIPSYLCEQTTLRFQIAIMIYRDSVKKTFKKR